MLSSCRACLRESQSHDENTQDWLDGCYSWIESELNLDPAKDLDAILYNVETQLLQSNLDSSMLPGTGLPPDVGELHNTKLAGPPVLVEIVSMTEIGQSAFNLQNVRQARIERADLAGLQDEDGEVDPETGSVPKYPRSMLRFQLSDGATILDAIEYRRIPEFELGVTQLGYKASRHEAIVEAYLSAVLSHTPDISRRSTSGWHTLFQVILSG